MGGVNSYLAVIMKIAAKTGLFGSFKTSTNKLAREINMSQQSASRILREVEEAGLIERDVSPNGVTVKLTDKSRKLLEQNYAVLRNVFENKKQELKGNIFSGVDEGGYYISLKGYQDQIIEKLGFKPFSGTLNVRVDKQERLDFLVDIPSVHIKGFKTKERSFSPLKAYKVKIKDEIVAIVVPERTVHDKSVVEIIAKDKLRDKFNLKEGDEVIITK